MVVEIRDLVGDILKHIHTVSLYATGRGEHVLYGHSSQIRVDPTDPIGIQVTEVVRNEWRLFDDRCPHKFKNPGIWRES